MINITNLLRFRSVARNPISWNFYTTSDNRYPNNPVRSRTSRPIVRGLANSINPRTDSIKSQDPGHQTPSINRSTRGRPIRPGGGGTPKCESFQPANVFFLLPLSFIFHLFYIQAISHNVGRLRTLGYSDARISQSR